jgi:glutaminyl-peptide cyclotransferase
MIDIIEYENSDGNYFGSYWHTHDDNMDVIDKNTLKAVGQTLIEVLYREKL